MGSKQRAWRPMSYADAANVEPCEGWQASPSSTTGRGTPHVKAPLRKIYIFWCSVADKAELRAKAEPAGAQTAAVLRETFCLVEARRRMPAPRVHPALFLTVQRIGGNLNQIDRFANRAFLVGRDYHDALSIACKLVVIEPQLAQILDWHGNAAQALPQR